jgi:hypothetical protein
LFLNYLYTEEEHLPIENLDQLKELFDLSEKLSFKELKLICVLNMNRLIQKSTSLAILNFCIEKKNFSNSLVENCFTFLQKEEKKLFSKKFKSKSSEIITFPPFYMLKKHITHLWKSKENFDILFKFTDDQVIKAHKFILISRSEYFITMINFMKESHSGNEILHIGIDSPLEIFNILLEFIYLQEISNFNSLRDFQLTKVIELADMYLLQDLKNQCIQLLKSKVNESNLFDLATSSIHLNFYDELKDLLIETMKSSFETNEICDNFFHLLSSSMIVSNENKSLMRKREEEEGKYKKYKI